jgi:hypothetical protein
MTTVTPSEPRDQPPKDHRPVVVKAAWVGFGAICGTVFVGIGKILTTAGESGATGGTTRYAITMAVLALALPVAAAMFFWSRR